jgi:cation diffusion facilitator CzcD-associated flavoprotein CzcO
MTYEPDSNGNGAWPRNARIAIVGTGFSGLGMAIRLKRAGIDDFVVLERADDVGGTWRENTYPGCQCDVPSHLYSFSFAPNPGWSRTFSRQPEIWDYLRDCAERFGVTPHIRFGHELREAAWDEEHQRWELDTSGGRLTAQVLVSGTGGLSEPSIPAIRGLEGFEGTVFHSAEWDHDHDLTGERVAVIGTGASAIQFVPLIQPQVGQLHLFQRTPPWIMPHSDRPVSNVERRAFRAAPFLQRLIRRGVYWSREALVLGLTHSRRMKLLEAAARAHLRAQVRDPELRARLTPNYRLGCKRILVSNDYYPALSRPNVEVLTAGIREVRPRSIVTEDGTEREVDTIILGTGFHVTDTSAATHVRGRDGRTLAEVWDGSPQAYLGTTVASFPNFFLLLGPNTGLGHTSVVFMIEAQIAHVMKCVRAMEEKDLRAVEVRPEVQEAYNDDIQAQMHDSVWTTGGCASWYIDEAGRNSTLWPDFTWRFRKRARDFDESDYLVRRAEPMPVVAATGEEAVR